MNGAVPIWNKRVNDFFENGTSPCPDCGIEMPAGDHDLRMAHYAVCGGKRVDAPVIEIDAEFKALIPKLSDDEYAALGTSLLAEGCRDALIVWRCAGRLILVDGHNRHEICTEHNIPFKTLEREFTDRNDVIVWMLRNQLGRRNLTDSARIRAAVRLKEVFETEAKERLQQTAQQTNAKLGRGKTGVPNSAHPSQDTEKGKSRDKAAGMAGVGKTKFSEGEYVMKHAPAALQVRWDAEEISTHAAYVLTKALEDKPQPVIDLALRVAGDNPEKVDILAQLHKSSQGERSNKTFDEIVLTGGFHFGKDMAFRCDFAKADVRTIKKALDTIAQQHKQLARDEHNATLDTAAQNAKSVTAPTETATRIYASGDTVKIGNHTLICADNCDVANYLQGLSADFVFADPPYNAHAADYDDGAFVWQQDYLIACAPIVAVTPGISSIQSFMQRTTMPYKWSTSCFIDNGMTRGALGFGNWIYTALFSASDSIHRNAQDVTRISISSNDKDENSSKRQKPPRYLAWLFDLFVPKGGLVIDAFSGSGMAVLVAEQLGLRCVAIEKDPQTFAALVARVEKGIGHDAKNTL